MADLCPCCGCRTLPAPREEAVAFVCPVCFWENDVFLPDEHTPSDENHGLTLGQARENFRRFGACLARFQGKVRPPTAEERR